MTHPEIIVKHKSIPFQSHKASGCIIMACVNETQFNRDLQAYSRGKKSGKKKKPVTENLQRQLITGIFTTYITDTEPTF